MDDDPQNTTEDPDTEQGAPSDTNPTNTGTDVVNEENRPEEPLGLRGVVYTDTEVELFWDPSPDDTVVSYQIARDGVDVANVDALSYYDNTVQPGTTYEFTLRSVNADGVRSLPVSQFLITPEKMPTINPVNAESLLDHVITVTNSLMFGKEIARAEALAMNLDEFGFTLRPSDPNDFMTSNYDCDIDGQLSFFTNGSALPSYFITLDNCTSLQLNDETINGAIDYFRKLSKFVYNSGISTDVTYESLTSTNQSNGRRELSGLYRSFDGPGASWVFSSYSEPVIDELNRFVLDENGETEKTDKPFIYTSAAFEGQTRLQINNITRHRGVFASEQSTESSNDWRHRLTADFIIQSPATGNKAITVTTPVEFFSDQQGDCFASGQLRLSAEDGSELLLNADTNNNETLRLDVIADGIKTENILLWSNQINSLHLTPDEVEQFYAADLNDIPEPEDCTVN